MGASLHSELSQRINRLRWQLPVLAFLLVLTDHLVEHIWLANLLPWTHFASQVLFYGDSGSVLAWCAMTALRRRADETEAVGPAAALGLLDPQT